MLIYDKFHLAFGRPMPTGWFRLKGAEFRPSQLDLTGTPNEEENNQLNWLGRIRFDGTSDQERHK